MKNQSGKEMRKTTFATDCYYHIYNRGVEKRVIFQGNKDYKRFLLGLEEFNTSLPTEIRSIQLPKTEAEPPEKLVEIVCFCLMPNHYHLIIKQTVSNGITQFMHKLGTGYAMYFNKKWKRSGILFEGNFKAKLIETDEYLLHLSRYIHLNPVDMINSHWKEDGIKDTNRVKKFLLGYYWSSYPIYIKKLTSHLISTEQIEKIITNVPNYEHFTLSYTSKDIATLMPLTLETPVPVHPEAEPPEDDL